jgi:hypothetical protein
MMPFDPIGYVPPQQPSPPPSGAPRLSPRGQRVMLSLVAALVILLFVLPFSADTFVDIIRAMRGD